MRSLILFALFIAIVALIALPAGVRAAWPPDGLLVCSGPFDQMGVKIVSDGAGGAIVAWVNPGHDEMYGQRLDGSGNPYWADGGIPLCSYYGGDRVHAMVSDDAGGAIILFGFCDLFAQRIDGSGALLWGPNGIHLLSGMDNYLVAVADGAGGVIIVGQLGSDILIAQKINSSGTIMWYADPGYVLVSDYPIAERFPSIIADGSGGAFIVYSGIGGHLVPAIMVQRLFTSGSVWGGGGVQVGGEPSTCEYPVIIGDGTGGAIMAWQEQEGASETYLCVQRIDSRGLIQWAGTTIGCMPFRYESPWLLSDGAGGAYIGWQDDRDGYYNIFAQRIDAYGDFLWTQEGVQVCQQDCDQVRPVLLPCEAGFIAVWEDQRDSDLIMGQKLDIGSGKVWSQDGVQIIRGKVDFEDYDFAADGAGGVLAAITDDRLMNGADIFAQSINTFGEPAAPEPVITDISDVPGDQGGYLRITLDRSERDDIVQVLQPVTNYDIWQRVDGLAVSSIVETGNQTGTILGSDDSRVLLTAPSAVNPDGTWEFIGSFDATQSDEYTFRGTTLSDSTASGRPPYSVYIITAHTTNPFAWFISEPDSGYSVDNLAPEPPLGLASEQSYLPEGLQLTWDQNMENDLWYYGVYRGTSDDFIPGPGNLIATPTGQEYLDGDWSWDVDYWYKISAVDIHGNESIFAVTGPDDITGDDPRPLPEISFLAQNYPNPFNPVTTIRFGLREAAHVRIVVYNIKGELVATILDRRFDAGTKEIVWEGKDDAGNSLASGIYHYRMVTGDIVRTKKMVLLH